MLKLRCVVLTFTLVYVLIAWYLIKDSYNFTFYFLARTGKIINLYGQRVLAGGRGEKWLYKFSLKI